MNILVLGRGLPSDKYPLNGIFEFDQAKALSEYGNDVTYFAIDLRSIRRFRKIGISHKKTGNLDCYIISIPLGRAPVKISFCIGKIALRFLYCYVYYLKKQHTPDVIHAHFTMPGYAAASLVKRTKIPLVITEHSSNLLFNNHSKCFIEYVRFAYGIADQVVSVSDYLGKEIYNKTGINTKTIFNIVDLSVFENVVRKEHEGFRYVVVANLVKSKAHELLLNAFTDVVKYNSDFYLDIIGDGPLRDRLTTITKDLHLESKVTFYGQLGRKDMVTILEKCDCFVLPSNFETFGVAYIEAMAAGVPIIATKCGGPEEFVVEEVGYLIEKNNRTALAQAMINIYENYGVFDHNKIRSYAVNNFSPNIIVKQLYSLYEEIIKERII